MALDFEVIHGIIRAGPNYNKFGDEYNFVANVTIFGDEALIRGAVGEFKFEYIRLIKKELAKFGIKRVIWERLKNDRKKSLKVDLL